MQESEDNQFLNEEKIMNDDKSEDGNGRASSCEYTTDEDDEFDSDTEAVLETPAPKKKRGRPFGSKNKKKKAKDEEDADGDEAETPAPRKKKTKSLYLDTAAWKALREDVDGSFDAAKALFEKHGPWELPSELKEDRFKDVALGTLSKMGRLDRYSVFAEPVSDSEAPGYSDVVTDPMDMSTMVSKVESGVYGEGSEAAAALYHDFALMFNNCFNYNDEDGEVIEEAARLFALVPETYVAQCALQLKKQSQKNQQLPTKTRMTPRMK